MFLTGQRPILLCVIAMDLLLEVVTDLLMIITVTLFLCLSKMESALK